MVAAGAAHGAESGAIENNNTNNDSLYSEKQPYYQSRIQLFEKYFTREQEKIAQAKTDDREISVALPDGKEIKAVANATTPWDIAMGISKKLAQASLVAHVDGNDWDMKRPQGSNCKLRLFSFGDKEGKELYWHSSAHVLGEALELEYGADLTIGPAIEEGFYYDCYLEDVDAGQRGGNRKANEGDHRRGENSRFRESWSAETRRWKCSRRINLKWS